MELIMCYVYKADGGSHLTGDLRVRDKGDRERGRREDIGRMSEDKRI